MIRHTFFNFSVLTLIFALSGCQGLNPVNDTAGYLFRSKSPKVNFLKGFEYLEIEWRGRTSTMVLGYRESQGSQVSEHWYSGQGEMLQLINGRIVQVIGMTKEVRNVSSYPPAWTDILTDQSSVAWMQTKEVMPRYRIGLQEFMMSRQSTPAASEKALAADATGWIIEEVKSKNEKGMPWFYQQKFALISNRVVYSEQCVTHEMCFKLKPLGVVVP